MMGIIPRELEGLEELPPATRKMLPTPQSYSQGESKSMPGLTPLDIAVRPELAKHAERAKERRKGLLPTPDANCWKQGERGTGTGGGQQLSDAMFTNPTGSAGPMRLNPLFVQWMMGYPPDWLEGVECKSSRR